MMKIKIKISLTLFLIACLTLVCMQTSSLANAESSKNTAQSVANPAAPHIQDEVVIKFKPQTNEHSQEQIVQKVTGQNQKTINATLIQDKPDQQDTVVVQTKNSPKELDQIVEELNKEPLVEYAEPNYLFKTTRIPNEYVDRDALAADQWGVNKIQAPDTWDDQTGSSQVVIAVVDTGVDWLHEDLSANIWTNPGEDAWSDADDPTTGNGQDDDGNGYIDDWKGWDFVDTDETDCTDTDCSDQDNNPADDQGHGTHVSGIAAAVTDNSTGVAGVCWNCRIMALRAGYEYEDDYGVLENIDAAAAIYYAVDNGADIINLSWGEYTDSATIRTAIEYAYTYGVLVVASAGNENISTITYPAGYDSVIAVAATDSEDNRSLWLPYGSNYGNWVDLAAPGTGILSTTKNDGYQNWSGTSMAAPMAAGVFGLLKSEHSSWSVAQLQKAVLNTCSDIGDATLGAGRIDAAQAVSFQALNISTTSLPQGTQGTAYSKTLAAAGSGTKTWSINSGSLPAGLSLNSSTGKISGTPTTSGTNSFTVKVLNSLYIPESDTQSLSLTIQPSDLNITTTSLPNGTANKSYSKTLAASGGSTPYTWSIASGSLPPGLQLFSSTGKISGTPTQIGAYDLSIKLRSSDSQQTTKTFVLTVNYSKTHINGTLVKTAKNAAVYLIENQTKKSIPSAAVFFSHHYDWSQIATIAATELAVYPNGPQLKLAEGTLVKSNTPTVYIINQNGSKSIFPGADIFLGRGYRWDQILTTTPDELKSYPTANPIGSDADGRVVKTSGSSTVWLLESGQKRAFPSAETFLGLGYTWSDLRRVSTASLNQYQTGPVVTLTHPSSTVVKKSSSPALYLLTRQNNKLVKKAFSSADIYLANGYQWSDVVLIHSSELSKYSTAGEIGLQQGLLVKSTVPTVYAIDNGTRRPIDSATDFLGLGYQWSAIKLVTKNTLSAYSTGSSL